MSKSDVLSLVNQFAFDRPDPSLISRTYDDLLRVLTARPVLAQFTLITVEAGQSTFTLPEEALSLHAVFYDTRHLDHSTPTDLEAWSTHWRDETGTPIAYTTTHETDRTFRLYPAPVVPYALYNPLGGPPFGSGHPPNTLTICYSTGGESTPRHLELILMLDTLTTEYSRESRHRDPAFAKACSDLSAVCQQLISLT